MAPGLDAQLPDCGRTSGCGPRGIRHSHTSQLVRVHALCLLRSWLLAFVWKTQTRYLFLLRVLNPRFDQRHVLLVQFDHYRIAIFFHRDLCRGSAAREWIEHRTTDRTTRPHAGPDQVWREHSEMSAAVWLCRHGPDAAFIPSFNSRLCLARLRARSA